MKFIKGGRTAIYNASVVYENGGSYKVLTVKIGGCRAVAKPMPDFIGKSRLACIDVACKYTRGWLNREDVRLRLAADIRDVIKQRSSDETG